MLYQNAVAWPGGSGRKYSFDVYPISTTINPGYKGNYIFAKQVGNEWHAVYIGEGDLKERVECHLRDGFVTKKGATHIHLLVNGDVKSRCAIESDLLIGNPESYNPHGCNEKIGG